MPHLKNIDFLRLVTTHGQDCHSERVPPQNAVSCYLCCGRGWHMWVGGVGCGWCVWVRRVYVVCMGGRANINWSHVIARTQVIYAAAGGSPLQLMLVFPTTSAKELT